MSLFGGYAIITQGASGSENYLKLENNTITEFISVPG
jgi:hypothetical protein